jgi:hypothetical protein
MKISLIAMPAKLLILVLTRIGFSSKQNEFQLR